MAAIGQNGFFPCSFSSPEVRRHTCLEISTLVLRSSREPVEDRSHTRLKTLHHESLSALFDVQSYAQLIHRYPLIFKCRGKVSQEDQLDVFGHRLWFASLKPVRTGLSLALRCIWFQWLEPRPPAVRQWLDRCLRSTELRLKGEIKGGVL